MCSRINVSQKTEKPLVIPEHLQDIYLRSSTKLTESEKHNFTELLIKYQDSFRLISQVSNKSTLGSNTPYLLKHSIFGMVTGINNCDSGGF
jgi:hypothetical protein